MDRRSTVEANASAFGRSADCSLVDQIRGRLKKWRNTRLQFAPTFCCCIFATIVVVISTNIAADSSRYVVTSFVSNELAVSWPPYRRGSGAVASEIPPAQNLRGVRIMGIGG